MVAAAVQQFEYEDAYVLVPPGDRQGQSPDRYVLHRSECLLLTSTNGALLLAGRPRWCGTKRELVDWTMREAGVPPTCCPTCEP